MLAHPRPLARLTPLAITLGSAWAVSACRAEDAAAPNPDESGLASNVTVIAHEFDTFDVEPGYEKDGLCQSWTLNNETDLWVNAVAFDNDGAWHHSNWLFVPDWKFDGPDGSWDCSEREYSELNAAMVGGVLFAQGTQSRAETQQFPERVAIRLPPHTRIIGGTHIQNSSAEPVTTQARMQLHTIPEADVTVHLNPFRLNYSDLQIPPRSTTEFTGECDIQAKIGEAKLDVELYYVMPHYHYLGTQFRLEVLGGERDGEVIVDHDAEPRGYTFDPPVSLAGADGVRFSCRYDNPRDTKVGFGIGDQEMCVMLAFADTRFILDAQVGAETEAVGETEGVEQFEGPCNVIAAQADIGGREY